MPHALIVAHGQPSDPPPAEAALAAFADQVDRLAQGVTVRSATLAAPGALESRLAELPEDVAIYPLFMAKGWFVTSALPRRIGERSARILDPLGIDPDLPELTARSLLATMSGKNWETSTTDLVIAAHGSGRSRNPSAVTNSFADQLRAHLPFRSVRVGFVEEPPSIAESATGLGERALCLPFFACTGGHVLQDVPEQLQQAGFQGVTLPVIGELPEIQSHIADVLTRECIA